MANLSELIAPAFHSVHLKLKKNAYTHWWLSGGRGSTKSSFISIEMVLGIMSDPTANANVFRKVKDTCRKSVYEQVIWAIDMLGCKEHWHQSLSPLELTYIPTGQKIVFRGADNSNKIKASTFAKGYCKYIWFEELDEFDGMFEVRKILQTLMRGGDIFCVFYSYNPPASINSWVNAESQYNRPDRLIHHSTYLDVPESWLGKPFILEAEELRKQNETLWLHEYMGEATGTGGEIFRNIKLKEISREEIDDFEIICRGLDFGFASDPSAYVELAYDRKHRCIYIFNEIYGFGMTNAQLIQEIKIMNKDNHFIIGDSAEPKSLHEMRQRGLKIKGCKKGRDSVDYGIKFLQSLYAIYIDDRKCPNTAREFLQYELEKDAFGEFKNQYPDYDNHTIDSTRYALNDEIMRFKDRKAEKEKKKEIIQRAERVQANLENIISGDVPREFFDW
jgi:phage terminase large subunit